MAKLTLYGTPASTYVRTARLLLESAGLDYDLASVNIFKGEQNSPEYRAKHPFAKVPALAIDDEVLYETVAIVTYLNEAEAGGQFSPQDPLGRARMYQMMAIVDSYLYGPAIQTIVIQRLIVPSQGGEPDTAAIAQAIAPVQAALQAIAALQGGGPYLLGAAPTLADFYLMPILAYLAQVPEFDAIMAGVPGLQAWWQKAQTLPVYSRVMG